MDPALDYRSADGGGRGESSAPRLIRRPPGPNSFGLVNAVQCLSGARISHFVHPTGLELVARRDNNCVRTSSLTFQTSSDNITGSTGVQHITEHGLLKKCLNYPGVTDLYQLACLGTHHTVLNAHTSPDQTTYHGASSIAEEHFRITDILTKLVLNSSPTPTDLLVEGCRLEYRGGKLVFGGIVYSEMSGCQGFNDDFFSYRLLAHLFPGSPYELNAWGDPAHIPNLKFDTFSAWHKSRYGPSNCRVVLTGDIDVDQLLGCLDRNLSQFSSSSAEFPRVMVSEAHGPRLINEDYPCFGDETEAPRRALMGWRLSKPLRALEIRFLDELLIISPLSPLHRMLNESGLAFRSDGGFERGIHDIFSIDARGVDRTRLHEFDAGVMATLDRVVKKGLDPALIGAVAARLEQRFVEEEIDPDRGEKQREMILGSWQRFGTPLQEVDEREGLKELLENHTLHGKTVENLIESHFLENPHRVAISFEPSRSSGDALENAEQQRLTYLNDTLTDAEKQEIRRTTRRITRVSTSSLGSEQGLGRLGFLTADKLREIRIMHSTLTQREDGRVFFDQLPVKGLCGCTLALDLGVVSESKLPYASLYGHLIPHLICEDPNLSALSSRVHCEGFFSQHSRTMDPVSSLILKVQSSDRDVLKVVDELPLLLTKPISIDDRVIQRAIEEAASDFYQSLTCAHNGLCGLRANAQLSGAWRRTELYEGIDFYRFLTKILVAARAGQTSIWDEVRHNINAVRNEMLLGANNRMLVLPGADTPSSFCENTSKVFDSLFRGDVRAPHQIESSRAKKSFEAVIYPTRKCDTAQSLDLFHVGYRHDGALELLINHLGSCDLYGRVRVRVSSYGTSFIFSENSGLLTLGSSVHPNPKLTLSAFSMLPQLTRKLDVSARELDRARVGAVRELTPTPGHFELANSQFEDHLIGRADDRVERLREEILAADLKALRSYDEVFEAAMKKRTSIVVTGNEQSLKGLRFRDAVTLQSLLPNGSDS